MKVIKPQTLGLLTRPFEFRREFWLGVSVIAFLPTGGAPMLLQEAAMWPFLAEELPPDQPLDAAIPKVQPEFLAVAHCFAPGGTVVPMLEVGIHFGPLDKTLNIYGDRRIERGARRITQPIPFTDMRLDWNRTYGGPGYADNPLGKGTVAVAESADVFPVQNVINAKLGEAGARLPAGYGPVDQMWPARAKLRGTYDDTWLKQDYPGYARDIDWHFFNVAPRDQWLPDKLTGDETYAFKNLNPEKELLSGRLPGLAPRLFLVRKQSDSDGRFEEVPLALTTVWFFPHRERLVMIHHGQARLAEEDAADIARVVIGADRADALRSPEHFYQVMMKRADSKYGAIHSLRDEDLVPGEWLPPPAATEDNELAGPRLALARARKRAERALEGVRERLRADGLDPDEFVQPLPPPKPAPTLAELPVYIESAQAEAAAMKEKTLAAAEERKAKIAAKLAESGMAQDEIEQRLAAKAKGPPAFSVAAVHKELAERVVAMRVLGQLTADLEAQLASPEFNEKLDRAEASVRKGYRLAAHLQDPADALTAERNAEIRELLATDSAAVRALYDLHGADLSGLDLSGLDLSGICLDSANLAGTRFTGANLSNAVLAHAAMQGCVLDGANLSGANLGRAKLEHASLKNAVLTKAVLAGADLTGASLAGADLASGDLSEAVTTGADFSNVHAPGLKAIKLSLPGLHAPGIVLTKSQFIECNLQGADLTGANMERTMFLQCNLAGAVLEQARLQKAAFVKQCSLVGAHLSDADLTEANLRETNLRGADLRNAIIERADLSRADLSNTLLQSARGSGSRLVAANLRRADLHAADLAKADLSRADLRGANLTNVSVYEANLPRAKLDEETQHSGMFRVRMRYLPLYQSPQEAQA